MADKQDKHDAGDDTGTGLTGTGTTHSGDPGSGGSIPTASDDGMAGGPVGGTGAGPLSAGRSTTAPDGTAVPAGRNDKV
jgi:hypothetical protein